MRVPNGSTYRVVAVLAVVVVIACLVTASYLAHAPLSARVVMVVMAGAATLISAVFPRGPTQH